MPASDTTNVTIVRDTPSLTRASFDTALIVGYHAHSENRVLTFGSLAELEAAGFAQDHPIYQTARALGGGVKRFKVGQRRTVPTMKHRVTLLNGARTYRITINGQSFSKTATPGGDVVDGVATDLVAQINASSLTVTAANKVNGAFEVLSDNRGVPYTIELGDSMQDRVALENITEDKGLADDLSAIEHEDPDWYAFVLDYAGEAEVLAAAQWTQARKRLFVALTADTETLNNAASTDVLSTLQSFGYTRTVGCYHHKPEQHLDAAILGRMLPEVPGSATWAHQVLEGVQASPLTAGHQSALENKNANYYTRDHGLGTFYWGTVSNGEFADVIRGLDDTQSQAEADISALLKDSSKVPLDNGGAGVIAATLEAVLRRKERDGLFIKDRSEVTAPNTDDPTQVSKQDKKQRRLPSVSGRAQLAGAVHTVDARFFVGV